MSMWQPLRPIQNGCWPIVKTRSIDFPPLRAITRIDRGDPGAAIGMLGVACACCA